MERKIYLNEERSIYLVASTDIDKEGKSYVKIVVNDSKCEIILDNLSDSDCSSLSKVFKDISREIKSLKEQFKKNKEDEDEDVDDKYW